MSFLRIALLVLIGHWTLANGHSAPASAQAAHPRLFFDAAEVPAFRARADQSPWRDMLASIEWAMAHDRSNEWMLRPSNPAALYLFRGDGPAPADWSEQALRGTLALVAHREWAQPGASALTRSAQGITVAIAYDLCHAAWGGRTAPATFTDLAGQTLTLPAPYAGMDLRAALSLALKNNSDSLIASGGSGFPGAEKEGNNWWGIRYAAAGLGYLASDEPPASYEKNLGLAANGVVRHLRANLTTDRRARGWNPEGIAYAQFAGWFTHPFALALRRSTGRDLVADIPALRYALWSTYTGVLPIERFGRLSAPGEKRAGWGRGLRPDFDDDHASWDGEGTGALAFAFAPADYLPGLKWQYRRLVGDLGDRTWDAASGNGLYSLLFYPHALAEKNPAEVWGLNYADPTYGAYALRNRFQDENDFVFQTTANLRSARGGHDGPDALSFRLWGLGVPWAVGAGRDYTAPHRGQTALFASDPEEMPKPGAAIATAVLATLLRRDGGGFVALRAESGDTGVSSHVRRMVVDYDGLSGAPGFFVIEDRSANGRFWRLNTPGFNRIETAPGSFTLVAPDGQRLHATILHPAGAKLRTGTFTRGNGFQYRDIGLLPPTTQLAGMNRYDRTNRWVDFETPDGRAVVALAVTPAGAPAPNVTGDLRHVRAGQRVIRLGEAPGDIEVEGWSRPVLSLAPPAVDGALLHLGAEKPATLAGRVTDPDGIASLVVLSGETELARLEGPAENFTLPLPVLPLGEHPLELLATDRAGDSTTLPLKLRITRSRPPTTTFEAPAVSPAEAPVALAGTATDPDGRAARVELQLYHRHPRDGFVWETLATVPVAADGTWSWRWSGGKLGPKSGHRTLRAIPIDADDDRGSPTSRTVKISVPFSSDPAHGDAADFHTGRGADGGDILRDGPGRWAVVEEDGDLRLRLRERRGHEYGNFVAFLRDSEKVGSGPWRLDFRFKVPAGERAPGLYVFFGQGTHGEVVLELARGNTRLTPGPRRSIAGEGTRVWYHGPNANRIHVAATLRVRQGSAAPDPALAGVPSAGWHRARVERVGPRLRVWIDDHLILDAESPWIATPGPIGFGNERLTGTIIFFDDISLAALPEPGTSAEAKP
jgi:hypothetical protein